MSDFILKTGGNSVLIGKHYYKGYFDINSDELIKVTRRDARHDEFKWLERIREIKNYKKYYSIPDELSYLISPSHKFYKHVRQITLDYKMTIFHEDLEVCFVNYAGDKDIQETLSDMIDGTIYPIWRNYRDIYIFAKEVMEALIYLHQHKLCHLDVKPENIVMNTKKRTFKLIDFGFTSAEPFTDYIKDPSGTPGYFPKNFKFDRTTEWLPFTNANDMTPVKGVIPMNKDPKLVYKIDSYSFGRVLYFVRHVYETYGIPGCFPWWTKNSKQKLYQIINYLLENDVHERKTIKECYELVINE